VRLADVRGVVTTVPDDPTKNTATAGLLRLIEDRHLAFGFEVELDKGIPLGSGMGGSAASAAGSVFAASALLDTPLTDEELITYALVGEEVASGAAHADNIAPCLFGGLQLVTGGTTPRITRLPCPSDVTCVLVNPAMRLDTRRAREVLRDDFDLGVVVEQLGHLAEFIHACHMSDLELLRHCVRDVLVEPRRAPLVPGFQAVRDAAMDLGALGCTISGAGPSVFAWCIASEVEPETVRDAMITAFADAGGLESTGYISPVDAPGARLVEAP